MSIFQILMLGASAYFAFKIYEHVQTLQDPQESGTDLNQNKQLRSADAFSLFDSSTLMQKADEARENNDFDKALAIYSEANIKAPKNAETLFKMGYTLILQERFDEALEPLLESISCDSQNPFAYKETSKVYEKLGNDEKAKEYKQKEVALNENI
jgi:tetratricopeptide (TPR) repeat protein